MEIGFTTRIIWFSAATADDYGSFTLLSGRAAGAELRIDDRLVAPDGCLRERTPAIFGRFLPSHAALLGNKPDVAIALSLPNGTRDIRGEARLIERAFGLGASASAEAVQYVSERLELEAARAGEPKSRPSRDRILSLQ